ncbi:MAG: diguanylate cyclase [Thermoanaerobaculia bacterium]
MNTPRRRRSDSRDSRTDSPIRVLLVDDDPEICVYLKSLIRRVGLECECNSDGENALEKLRSGAFDFLFCDFEMPRLDGLEVITRVRLDESLKDIYAVMLTGHEDLSLKIRALTSGYDDFLSKGCSEIEIAAKVAAAKRLLSRQRLLNKSLREWQGLASHDELTGLANRRTLFDHAHRLLVEQRPFTLILFDLDDFKKINDVYGHLTGDTILRDLGSLLLRSTRYEDVVARYGGDEFILLVTEVVEGSARALAARLKRLIGALRWTAGEETISIDASFGIGVSELLPNGPIEQILEAADRDLYATKWLRTHPDATAEELYQYRQVLEPRVIRLKEQTQESDQKNGSRARKASDLPANRSK